ncbi:carbonic anhydrase family protein [uncultured Shewanella sp.]|uniref:carbonic anhydrase n=1 Tax=uncultured Shewanella sp. TaxID=173975 RepID=UPI00262F7EBE|nr:carbonic anhydrase family protein [uncultured Shewanella sp.]
MKNVLSVICAVSIGLASHAAVATEQTQWGYSGDIGPSHWGKLAPNFSTCVKGVNQSPINLTGMIKGDLPKLYIQYQAGGAEVLNNGHTIEVVYGKGSSINVENTQFDLKQLHFHSPSENTIEGESFPMEVHFVNADKAGHLAVVGVMFKEGAYNPALAKIWDTMPKKVGQENRLNTAVNINQLLPKQDEYYRFNGSLTTPPCSEGVQWFVMKEPITASKAQIAQFTQLFPHGNNRPIQSVNARMILQ